MRQIAITLIELYQAYFSRDYSFWRTDDTRRICREHPSCSQYAKLRIREFGVAKGAYL